MTRDDEHIKNDSDRNEQQRARMARLIETLKEAALGTGDLPMLSQLNVALIELERLTLLRHPHLAEIELAIVRAEALLNRLAGED